MLRQAGIHDNGLVFRVMLVIESSEHNDEGTLPISAFLLSESITSFDIDPKVDGIVPPIQLLFINKLVTLLRYPRLDGMVPVRPRPATDTPMATPLEHTTPPHPDDDPEQIDLTGELPVHVHPVRPSEAGLMAAARSQRAMFCSV